ncbi:MAG: hypothetical protein JNK57_17425 [Planctomycetaceae bacterium]|nr:hypothetical protein [Planctomycetaceae bacterium]
MTSPSQQPFESKQAQAVPTAPAFTAVDGQDLATSKNAPQEKWLGGTGEKTPLEIGLT